MPTVVYCPACKTPHAFEGALGFREECARCAADLHVCLICRFHDRYVENECRETEAEYVAAKDRRNLCEYFRPRAPSETPDATAEARAKLEALFGGKAGPAAQSDDGAALSPQEEAKRRLEQLFKKS
ncbi:MAG: hypothetical protein ACO3JL_05330 [Myxococcota bacterium]